MFSMSRSSSGPSYTNFKGNIKVSSLIYVSTISLADFNLKPNFFFDLELVSYITRNAPIIHYNAEWTYNLNYSKTE